MRQDLAKLSRPDRDRSRAVLHRARPGAAPVARIRRRREPKGAGSRADERHSPRNGPVQRSVRAPLTRQMPRSTSVAVQSPGGSRALITTAARVQSSAKASTDSANDTGRPSAKCPMQPAASHCTPLARLASLAARASPSAISHSLIAKVSRLLCRMASLPSLPWMAAAAPRSQRRHRLAPARSPPTRPARDPP